VLDKDDVEAIRSRTDALSQAAMKLGEAMYRAQQTGAAGEPETGGGRDSGVVDAEFEEVDDDKKRSA
jgi:molecular chaperone DnaK